MEYTKKRIVIFFSMLIMCAWSDTHALTKRQKKWIPNRIFKSVIPEDLVQRNIISKRAYKLFDGWYKYFQGYLVQKIKSSQQFENEIPITIIIPSYNNKDWYELNLLSVVAQQYDNYKVIYINDCSTDGTGQLAAEFVRKLGLEDKIQVINNDRRRGALYNLYHAIHSCSDNTVVVTLDGDDWFDNKDVLATINNAYANANVLLTYGQMGEFRHNAYHEQGFCKQLPATVIKENSYRSYSWVTSHLRTFYAGLFKKIKKEDLQNKNGEFWSMTWDQAFMFPMLEMAAGRVKFISDVLYVYNMATPTNDNKVNAQLQRDCEKEIRALPKYKPLSDAEVNSIIQKENE